MNRSNQLYVRLVACKNLLPTPGGTKDSSNRAGEAFYWKHISQSNVRFRCNNAVESSLHVI